MSGLAAIMTALSDVMLGLPAFMPAIIFGLPDGTI